MGCRVSGGGVSCLLVGLLLLSAGCGESKSPIAATGNTLEGKITINQKTPMLQGMVFVFNASSREPVARGRIKDGSYSIRNAPAGEVQLVVTFDLSPRPSSQVSGGEAVAIRASGPPRLGERPPPPPTMDENGKIVNPPAPTTPGKLDPKLIDAIEAKYGTLLGEGRLIRFVTEGHNTFDIDLTTP